MRRLSAAFFILLGLANAALAQAWPNPSNQLSIAGTVAAATRIIQVPTGKQIVVTALMQAPVATSVVTYTYGTGTNCGTDTGSLTGAMTFAAGQEINMGNGVGPVMIVPPGNDLCVTIATAAAPGSLVYTLVP
jgi:hypothetical protein